MFKCFVLEEVLYLYFILDEILKFNILNVILSKKFKQFYLNILK